MFLCLLARLFVVCSLADTLSCIRSNTMQVVESRSTGKKKSMTSWADSDTESDVEAAAPPQKKLDAFGEEESESESESESEEESEVR